MHNSELSILFFVIISLLIGALLKALMHNSRLPYTVILLLIGVVLGGLNQLALFGTNTLISDVFTQIGHINPHLILYLFLPTLIFESAYSMEPHLFFRIAPQIILLAVLGLIISMLLSALAVHWLLSWGLGAALLFGALISATDPVAVVALLNEKSSRKRLQTLIEGESLLNDGTAIVFFSLFYGFALGTTTEINFLPIIGEFLWVVVAGLVVGAIFGWIVLWVIGKLIDQPMIEITLSVTTAYLCYFFAESLQVSGIIALVSLALMFSTIGRTRISPEISHFLHQFWQMMTYMANTLIFIIVGLVIVTHTSISSHQLWIILGLLYVLLLLIRTVTILVLMPLLHHIGIGITNKKATVLVWGGLRGAVSLSLALALAQDLAIPELLRQQILFLTAGIVFLTIVINGSTMEWLLHKLHLDELPLAKQATVQKARKDLDKQMNEFLKTLILNPFFNQLNRHFWDQLSSDSYAHDKKPISLNPFSTIKHNDLSIAFMRRLLEIERSDYWRQFEEGYIGRQASFVLTHSVEKALDNSPIIAPRDSLNTSFKVPKPPQWVKNVPIMGSVVDNSIEQWLISHLSLGYDIARGFVMAQEEMRKHIKSLQTDEDTGNRVEAMIDQNCTQALTFSAHVTQNHPHLIAKLQSKSAQRLSLNHERSLIWKMQYDGVLESSEADHLIDMIEQQMLNVRNS